MTSEEAILLSAYTGFLLAPDFSKVHKFCEDTLGRPIWTHEFADSTVQKEIQEKLHPQIMELIKKISALRPVSREQVEKVPRCEHCKDGKSFDGQVVIMGNKGMFPLNFCPRCGSPLTDEAVDMVMERMEALYASDT